VVPIVVAKKFVPSVGVIVCPSENFLPEIYVMIKVGGSTDVASAVAITLPNVVPVES